MDFAGPATHPNTSTNTKLEFHYFFYGAIRNEFSSEIPGVMTTIAAVTPISKYQIFASTIFIRLQFPYVERCWFPYVERCWSTPCWRHLRTESSCYGRQIINRKLDLRRFDRFDLQGLDLCVNQTAYRTFQDIVQKLVNTSAKHSFSAKIMPSGIEKYLRKDWIKRVRLISRKIFLLVDCRRHLFARSP